MKPINSSILNKVYKKRKSTSHKGDFGRLIIIGGSNKYTGTPALNAQAALSSLKTGVDIVEIASPTRSANIIAKSSPNLITITLKGDYLSPSHLQVLLKESKNKSAFVIGGGIERNPKTLILVRNFLKKIKLPGVVDADAIYALKNQNINLKNFIITPHEQEFKVLTGINLSKNLNEKIEQVKKTAKKLNTTILLKGKIDIITNYNQTAINKTGNPYMTVGGTGDILAGIAGSLIAQGNNLFDSACAAAFINGLATEKIKKKVSLTATDLIKGIERVVG